MARITVEDCLEKVPNLFQLVLVAAKRARQLANGAHPMVDWENDKPTVVALREIAEGYITEDILTQRDKPVEDLLAADLAAVQPLSPDDLRLLADLPKGPATVRAGLEICHGATFDEDHYVFSPVDAARSTRVTSGRSSARARRQSETRATSTLTFLLISEGSSSMWIFFA